MENQEINANGKEKLVKETIPKVELKLQTKPTPKKKKEAQKSAPKKEVEKDAGADNQKKDKKKVAVAKGKEKGVNKKEWKVQSGTPAESFITMVKDSGKDGISMAEAKKAKWNKTSASFYHPTKMMVKQGLFEVRDYRIYFIK